MNMSHTMIQVQPAFFPGLSSHPYPLAAGVELSDDDVKRLALAVAARALKDCKSRDKLHDFDRRRAIAWLREDGATWLQALGCRIGQADIDAFLKGLVTDGK